MPFRPLQPDAGKGVGPVALDGNLIIHGDNLHALKALLPTYAGKMDCVFIDPPYNTGNEGWSYNDNVNSPMIKEWLSANPVGVEDGLRHDKWCAMMWPRLRLLYELLSEHGSLWMTLDDNEVHRARSMLDEIFGAECCIGQIAWQKRTSRENRATLSPSIDHILVYSKPLPETWKLRRNLLLPTDDGYSNPDKDPRGVWASIPFSAQGFRENQVYTITTPTGIKHQPPKGRCWGATEPEFEKLKAQQLVYWPKNGAGKPRIKQFPDSAKGLVPMTLWTSREVGDTEESKKQLLEIFSDRDSIDFHAPKPPALIQRVLEIATKPDSIVLDSFAGTASTAHAVLAQNRVDGGNRRFVLVEMEDYADSLTAERVRRVIKGYEFVGSQKEELLRSNITFTTLKNAADLLEKISGIENLDSHRFDKIGKEVKEGVLIVIGEKTARERVEGLGGEFTYCTLNEPLELDKILRGDSLPTFASLGAALFHMATNRAFDADIMNEADGYLGETAGQHVWLIYRSDLDWLKSPEAALTLQRAKDFAAAKPGKAHLVFAPSRFVSQKLLSEQNIPVEFVPLPFALYRIERAS